ncbi:MAG: winged helix-turn-helix domain-containing protein [Steroidobacterales bacterium]
MTASDHRALRIGDWRVEPALDEISRDGKTLKLEPRTMRVLICLAEHAGEVVSVEQLLDAVWKDVVVTQDSVYQAVAALRRALGDDPREPRYIANVLRRGYRVVAPVAAWDDPKSPSGNASAVQVPASSAVPSEAPPLAPAPVAMTRASPGVRRAWTALLVVAALAVGYPLAEKLRRHAPATGPAPTTPAATLAIREPSVAVLPFLDLSATKDQQYLADGLSEELIDRLTKVPRLHVVARTSSFYFQGKQATVADIARTLGVTHLLEGSVRKSGDTLRITTRLVRAGDGFDAWSETYDRPLADVFKVQDEIAGAVVQVLRVSISQGSAPEPILTANPEAHALYLRALANISSNGAHDYEAAEDHLHAALLLDPQFAGAWAALAMVMIWKFDWRGPVSSEACVGARAAAARAVELDAALSQTHRAQGMVLHYCDRNLAQAEVEFKRALELQPDDSLVLMSYAWLASEAGRFDQALALARRATAIDPLNAWAFEAVGDVEREAGRWQDAEAPYRKAVELDPSAAGLHAALANILLANHKPIEAVAEAQREPDPEWRMTLLPMALDAAGRTGDADRELAAFKLRYGDNGADWIALFYACRHDADRAIQWLTVYAARHEGRLWENPSTVLTCLDNLRSDPRYPPLERQMKADHPKK